MSERDGPRFVPYQEPIPEDWRGKVLYVARNYSFALALSVCLIVFGGLFWWLPGNTLIGNGQDDASVDHMPASLSVVEGGSFDGPAKLYVFSSPSGATVHINEEEYSTTPVIGTELEGGTQRIRIELDGYIAIDTSIVLRSGALNSLSVSLDEEIIRHVQPAQPQAVQPPRQEISRNLSEAPSTANDERERQRTQLQNMVQDVWNRQHAPDTTEQDEPATQRRVGW